MGQGLLKLVNPQIVESITIEAFDEPAKCLCHETDHLDGILFTDKVIEYVEMK